MATVPTNYFISSNDLKVLTDNCVYITTCNADMAITNKGNIFIRIKGKTKNKQKIIEQTVRYLVNEGWKIKKACNIYVY